MLKTIPYRTTKNAMITSTQKNINIFIVNGREIIHDCKNTTPQEITEKLTKLQNQWGAKNRKWGSGKISKPVSVQGEWTPWLWKFSNATKRDFLPTSAAITTGQNLVKKE